MKHSPHLARLIDALRALPGVGPKSAQRMAFHLLQEGRPGARALAEALDAALEHGEALPALPHAHRGSAVRHLCGHAARRGAAVRGGVAGRRGRDRGSPAATAVATSCSWGICRRSTASDRSSSGVRELEAILAEGGVRELILATNSTVEGEATAHFLSELATRARHARQPHRPWRAGRRRARVRRRRHARARARRPPVAVARRRARQPRGTPSTLGARP